MQEKKRKLDLVSPYMNHGVLGARDIRLQLEESKPGHMKGTAIIDPNICKLDLWGDRGACTKMAIFHRDTEATMMRTLDPQGHKRIHWVVDMKDVSDAKINLIEYPKANLWYLTVVTEDEGTTVVPLFDAELFTLDAAGTVQLRYGVPIRDILKRGDVAEMRAEADLVRRALAELDAEPAERGRLRSLNSSHVDDVRAALKELDDALAKIEA